MGGSNVPLIPDGTVDTADAAAVNLTITDLGDEGDVNDGAADGAGAGAGAGSGAEFATLDEANAAVFDAAVAVAAAATEDSEATAAAATQARERPVRLLNHRSCYTCKRRFRELHPFYDQVRGIVVCARRPTPPPCPTSRLARLVRPCLAAVPVVCGAELAEATPESGHDRHGGACHWVPSQDW